MAEVNLRNAYASLEATWRALDRCEQDALIDQFVLDYAYNSGKIENDNVTLHDTREIFENGKVISFTGDVRTLFEIQNLKYSWQWARREARPGLRFEEAIVLHAHLLLTRGIYDEARWSRGERPGTFKRHHYVVGASGVGALPEDVEGRIGELLDDVNGHMDDETNALVVAAFLHAQLADIHPFADGNGRTARLLMNMALLSMGAPPIVVREEDRIAYYGALDAFHDAAELSPLIDFLRAESLGYWDGLLTPGR